MFLVLVLHAMNSHPEADAPDSVIEVKYLLSKNKEPIHPTTILFQYSFTLVGMFSQKQGA